jgi:N-methylhydantoinase B
VSAPAEFDAADLAVFGSRVDAICAEMGAALARAAFSPNIRDRLDLSCALFDLHGELVAQAAHIPVHLGSMAYAMRDLVRQREWQAGDTLIVNDPYLGGTHLPDVTLIAPAHAGDRLIGFVAARAHHADIGAATPGSMPISRTLEEEGLIIPPSLFCSEDRVSEAVLAGILAATRTARVTRGDLYAQLAAVRLGRDRAAALAVDMGPDRYAAAIAERDAYSERLARAALAELPTGRAVFTDYMDDDGVGTEDLAIQVELCINAGEQGDASGAMLALDFAGTAAQVAGNVNCPVPVTAAAASYVLRCLMPAQIPACAGAMRALSLSVPDGCLLNPRRPAAVAAGNVETSMRVVDAVLGALAQLAPDRVAAASQGTMNNVAFGGARGRDGEPWAYYETIAGGTGAHAGAAGPSGLHSHMTNTRNTPVEVLESSFPLRVRRYALRRGSGGAGQHRGGDGLIRVIEFLAPATLTVISERRRHAPWGLAGGADGARGRDQIDRVPQPGKFSQEVKPGQVLTLETPGGGGYGTPT